MRIDHLSVQNFKGFESRDFSFHPEFNLVVGVNGTGKTSLLEALAVAAGSWFLGVRDYDSRHIRTDEIRSHAIGSSLEKDQRSRPGNVHWEPQLPCIIKAEGEVQEQHLTWQRTLASPTGRTTERDAKALKALAVRTCAEATSGHGEVLLPLICNYGTGRLWNEPRAQTRVRTAEDLPSRKQLSRLSGYRDSIDARLSVADLVRWIAQQSFITFQEGGREPKVFSVVRKALTRCLDGAEEVYFQAQRGEVIVRMSNRDLQTFDNLSDGQRTMLALVGDIATKAARLNPHLDSRALAETPGVVLIDELDLHLHPKWQRHVIEDLRRTFPKIQFIATTHSPFLIQSMRSGEELLVLDGQPTASVADLPISQIVRGIQGVSNPEVSARYDGMKSVARDYLEMLEEAAGAPKEKLEAYKARLAESIAPYADNPAFQAFLEMKRAARLGD